MGLGKACEIALRDLASQMTHLRTLRDLLEEKIGAEIPDIRFSGLIGAVRISERGRSTIKVG